MRALLSAGLFLPRHLYAQRLLQQRQALQQFPLLPRREPPQQFLLEGQHLGGEAGEGGPAGGCQGEVLEAAVGLVRSEEHTSELQSLMRISYAVFCLKKKTNKTRTVRPAVKTPA